MYCHKKAQQDFSYWAFINSKISSFLTVTTSIFQQTFTDLNDATYYKFDVTAVYDGGPLGKKK